MKSNLWSMWLVVSIIAGTAIALAGRSAITARQNAATEVNRFDLLVGQARTLSQLLRGQAPVGGPVHIPFRPGVGLSPQRQCHPGLLRPARLDALVADAPDRSGQRRAPESATPARHPDAHGRDHTSAVGTLPGGMAEARAGLGGVVDRNLPRRHPVELQAGPGGDLPLRVIVGIETLRLQSAGGER